MKPEHWAYTCRTCSHHHKNEDKREDRVCLFDFCTCSERPTSEAEQRKLTREYNRAELAQRPEGCRCDYSFFPIVNGEHRLTHRTASNHVAHCPHHKVKQCTARLVISAKNPKGELTNSILLQCTNKSHRSKTTHTYWQGMARISWDGRRGETVEWLIERGSTST